MNRDPRVDPQPGDETKAIDARDSFVVTRRTSGTVWFTHGDSGEAMIPIDGWIRQSKHETVLRVAGEPDSPLVSRSDKVAEALTFDAYQAETRKTAIYGSACDNLAEPGTPANKMLRLSYVSLGLGEAGEIQGKVKKLIRDRDGELTTDDLVAIAKELGDLLFYVSASADEIGVPLGEVARMNVEKLRDRQQRGVLGGSGDNR